MPDLAASDEYGGQGMISLPIKGTNHCEISNALEDDVLCGVARKSQSGCIILVKEHKREP